MFILSAASRVGRVTVFVTSHASIRSYCFVTGHAQARKQPLGKGSSDRHAGRNSGWVRLTAAPPMSMSAGGAGAGAGARDATPTPPFPPLL